MGITPIIIMTTEQFRSGQNRIYILFVRQVIQQRGYGRAVDLWALGVLLHELLSGHTPFDAPSAMESFQRAVRGVAEVDFSFYEKRTPDGADAVSLVKALCQVRPMERLGMGYGGYDDIRQCGFYFHKNFEWASHEAQLDEVPHRPVIKSVADCSNFDARENEMPRQLGYFENFSQWDKGFASGEADG